MPEKCIPLLPEKKSHHENTRTEANHPRFQSGVLEDTTLPGRDQYGLPVAALRSTTKAMPVSPYCLCPWESQLTSAFIEDEGTRYPRSTPMGKSIQKYKSLESEGEAREDFYDEQAERYAAEAAQDTPPYRRKFKGIDDYHRRAENTAFRTSDNFHEASKARREHNINYMAHFKSCWDAYRHEGAELTDEEKSEEWHATENAHRDLRAVNSKSPSLSFFLQTSSR